MNRILSFLLLICFVTSSAQQHFSGINTSSRSGILNGSYNPAELANISSKFEVNLIAPSIKASSNKIGFNDLTGGSDIEMLLFDGNENADLRIDAEVLGPGVAFKYETWSFALTTKAYGKLDLVNIDPGIGDAIANGGINSVIGTTFISNGGNQRLNGTTWGEVGLSAAKTFYEDETHKFNAGVTLKLLFPGSYANFGASEFSGNVNNVLTSATLTDASANLNIAYSGNLGRDFTSFSDYTGSVFGKLNGFATDFGVNYQWKDTEPNRYKVNAGVSVRNLGSMTFKDSNNSDTNYQLSIQGTESLDLNQFQDVTSLEEVEQILLESGYLNRTVNNATDFRVKLPTTLNVYADVKIIGGFYATVFTHQKLNEDQDNAQIANENVTSLTPRYVWENIELFSPWSTNEISGISGGLGFRAYGFYIGSGSILTAVLADSKQADFYLGYNFRFP